MAHRLRLRYAPVVTLMLCVAEASAVHAQALEAQPAEARYFVTKLEQGMPGHLRDAVARAGYREVSILPGQRLLLEKIASTAEQAALHRQLALRPFAASERVSSELLQLTAAQVDVPVLIHAMPGTAGEALLRWLQDAGLPRLGSGKAGDTLRISTRLPAAQALSLATELAGLEDTFFVERIHHLGLFNDRSAGSVQAGKQGATDAATPIWSKGLHGEGQIVGLIDTGVDADACWFSGASEQLPKTNTWSMADGYGKAVDDSHSKIIAYDFLYSCDQYSGQQDCDDPKQSRAWDSNGHGTHCSGSMVGHRMSGGNNGMAPAAKLVVQDAGYKTNDCADLPGIGCPVVDLYPLFEQAYAQGVRVHNNSYGDNENAPTPQPSNYSARSQDVDRFIWDHKDMLLVFAAGNSGMGDAEFSVCSPSTNKNGLSVGSARTSPTATSDDDISSFSSRGWTADGRIKPELIAPGCNTSAATDRNSTSHNCAEDSGCGTSYAAPVLVGAAALVRQYFTDGFYPSGKKSPADALLPTAALLKAMLINGAVSMSGRDNARQDITPIPSNEQGWGRIQLDRSLMFEGATRALFVDDHKVGFEAGSTAALTYTFDGVDAAEPLKVTLAWTDYPGNPDSAPRAPKLNDMASFNAPQLVNDLDLAVSDGTSTYLGNAFKDGTSAAAGMPDKRNNVEQVLLPKPNAGTWTITVKPSAITKASQDFALVVTGKWTSARATDGASGMQPSAAGSAAPASPSSGAAGTGATAAAAGAAAHDGAPTQPTAATTRSTTASAGSASPAQQAMDASFSGTGSKALSQSATAGALAPTMQPMPGSGGGCSALGQRRPPQNQEQNTTAWLLGVTGAALGFVRSRRRTWHLALGKGRTTLLTTGSSRLLGAARR